MKSVRLLAYVDPGAGSMLVQLLLDLSEICLIGESHITLVAAWVLFSSHCVLRYMSQSFFHLFAQET